MKKRVGAIIFLILAVLALPFIFARGGICDPSDDGQKVVCDGGIFGIDSTIGLGAAEICSECYVCGDADGVCPEDFKNESNNYVANCSGCNDPDCYAIINGVVRKRDPPNDFIEGAQVKAVPHNPHIPEVVTFTNETGEYELNVSNGPQSVSAAKIGLDTEINDTIVYTRQFIEMNFFLPNASCDENCSNYFGRCNKDCQGINGCEYEDWDGSYSEIAQVCHERRLGENIVMNQTGNYSTNVMCCDGSVTSIEYRPQALVEGKMKNLITTSTNALYNGMPVTITIATWMPGG
ncbi:MAG: hypothetical protein ABIJ21_05270 [Nanoarchaeota archaeon]